MKTWAYGRTEIPTRDLPSPRSGRVRPYPPQLARQLDALSAADDLVAELIGAVDGGLYLTVIARRRSAS